jgi:anti-sigma factor RsiW
MIGLMTGDESQVEAAMDERLSIEQQMIKYLLGELSIKDKLEMEMEYFTDPEIFDLLQHVEHDLIEGYVNGKLSPSGRLRFERSYLATPVRLERVRFFQTLTTTLPLESYEVAPDQEAIYADAYDTSKLRQKTSIWGLLLAPFRAPRLAFGISMAAAILILGVVGAMRIFETQTPVGQRLAQNTPRPSPEKKAEEPPPIDQPTPEIRIVKQTPEALPTATPKVPVIASFVWTVPGTRSTGNNAPRLIRISPGNDTVQLTLNFPDLPPDRYSRFSASIQDSTGREIWKRSDIKASRVKSGSSMVLRVPAKQFQNGSFSLMLGGNNSRDEWVDIREFYIKVER